MTYLIYIFSSVLYVLKYIIQNIEDRNQVEQYSLMDEPGMKKIQLVIEGMILVFLIYPFGLIQAFNNNTSSLPQYSLGLVVPPPFDGFFGRHMKNYLWTNCQIKCCERCLKSTFGIQAYHNCVLPCWERCQRKYPLG